jgi:hypothetical protein
MEVLSLAFRFKPLLGDKSKSMASPILSQEPILGRFTEYSFPRGKQEGKQVNKTGYERFFARR